jgi:hypothetical protein
LQWEMRLVLYVGTCHGLMMLNCSDTNGYHI